MTRLLQFSLKIRLYLTVIDWRKILAPSLFFPLQFVTLQNLHFVCSMDEHIIAKKEFVDFKLNVRESANKIIQNLPQKIYNTSELWKVTIFFIYLIRNLALALLCLCCLFESLHRTNWSLPKILWKWKWKWKWKCILFVILCIRRYQCIFKLQVMKLFRVMVGRRE
jgi:hypothetical protein